MKIRGLIRIMVGIIIPVHIAQIMHSVCGTIFKEAHILIFPNVC
jgi:hypothetical protein